MPQPPRPFQGAPPPPSSSNSNSNSYSFTAPPARVGSILLSASPITIPIFSKELDLASVANPQKHSTIKQYLFGLLLFKPLLALLLDCFSLVFLSAWVSGSAGKGNSSGLVIYALATTGSIGIMIYGGWRASQVLRKGNIQGIFVTREAYRFVCLTSRDKFLFFERVGQGYGKRDALVYFTWFTLRGNCGLFVCLFGVVVVVWLCCENDYIVKRKAVVCPRLGTSIFCPSTSNVINSLSACFVPEYPTKK